MTLSLIPQCAICKSRDNLQPCPDCKLILYCSDEHRTKGKAQHQADCKKLDEAQRKCDQEEHLIRVMPPGFMTPANMFEERRGHFWGLIDTRDYMRARFGVVEALQKIGTAAAIQAALDHLIELQHLNHSDNMGLRDVTPGLFLRLGQDQECYDFIKWWAVTMNDDSYDSDNLDLPHLSLRAEDVFEPIDLFVQEYADLSHAIAIALIKFRLLLDLRALHQSNRLGAKVPPEIMAQIRGNLVSIIVSGNKYLMESYDPKVHGDLVKRLEKQVKQAFDFVKRTNEHVWPAMLNPGKHLDAMPAYYSSGTVSEMQLMLRYHYRCWKETPGAIDLIKELSKPAGASTRKPVNPLNPAAASSADTSSDHGPSGNSEAPKWKVKKRGRRASRARNGRRQDRKVSG